MTNAMPTSRKAGAFSRTGKWVAFAILLIVLLGAASTVCAQILPKVTVGVEKTTKPQDAAVALEIIFLMTILTLAPSILILMTSFTRIVVVLSFLRHAMGTQTMPPNQVVVGMALFLTAFIMMPTITTVNDTALQPYLEEKIDYKVALKRAMNPIRGFMLRQCDEKDVALFVRVSKSPQPRNVDDLPNEVILPAFVISELKTAFTIGFICYVPFLIIDMVVASVLLSMGMMMLPPVMISLPFKIILFVLVDGWNLVVQQLVTSFR